MTRWSSDLSCLLVICCPQKVAQTKNIFSRLCNCPCYGSEEENDTPSEPLPAIFSWWDVSCFFKHRLQNKNRLMSSSAEGNDCGLAGKAVLRVWNECASEAYRIWMLWTKVRTNSAVDNALWCSRLSRNLWQNTMTSCSNAEDNNKFNPTKRSTHLIAPFLLVSHIPRHVCERLLWYLVILNLSEPTTKW